jgi:hypothetical protein
MSDFLLLKNPDIHRDFFLAEGVSMEPSDKLYRHRPLGKID